MEIPQVCHMQRALSDTQIFTVLEKIKKIPSQDGSLTGGDNKSYRSVDVFEANLQEISPLNSGLVYYTTDPVTGLKIVKYYDIRGTIDTTYSLPNIQSQESFNQVKYDSLNYELFSLYCLQE